MENAREIRLEDSWKRRLADEFAQPYMERLRAFLIERKRGGATIYPPGGLIFNALDSTPFERVKVVIIGQDPYHGPGQAHGLCFSVPEGIAPPPSLLNIYREIEDDVGGQRPPSGNLQAWADQGVLLLNAVLTVERGRAAAHASRHQHRLHRNTSPTTSAAAIAPSTKSSASLPPVVTKISLAASSRSHFR